MVALRVVGLGVQQRTLGKEQASKLFVDGIAELTNSQFSLIPVSTGTQPVTLVETSGTLVLGQNTVYDNGQLGQFSYQLSTPSATTLQVTQQAQMAAVASKAGLRRTEQGVARHLDANFAAGTPGLGDTLLALGRIVIRRGLVLRMSIQSRAQAGPAAAVVESA